MTKNPQAVSADPAAMAATAAVPASRFSEAFFPLLAIWAAVIFWGASFSAAKSALAVVGPWGIMWARMSVALIILLPFARRLWPRCYRAGDWKPLMGMVVLMPCAYFSLEANALRFTTSSQAGVISSSVPLLVGLGAWMFLKERVSVLTFAGLGLAMAGVAWLTMAGTPSQSASNPLLGNIMELGAMTAAAGSMVVIKNLSDRYNPWTLTAMQVVLGWFFFMPGASEVLTKAGTMPPLVLFQLIFLGACASLGAFGLYNWGMSRIPASRASAYINLVPVVAVFFGWTLLGEALNPSQLAASALVFGGVWVSQRR